ncbi:MAG TPA: hypothetical protein VK283_10765 [Acidimicrobiales bacterium]|nr:hypothetical protein [Acidimicrobiales bacterium]
MSVSWAAPAFVLGLEPRPRRALLRPAPAGPDRSASSQAVPASAARPTPAPVARRKFRRVTADSRRGPETWT